MQVNVKWASGDIHDGDHSYKCQQLEIGLCPIEAEDNVWMQGLLLALTGGFEGLLLDGRLSSMPGDLAACKQLKLVWNGTCAAMSDADKSL